MISTQRLVDIENELMSLQHELQQYIVVDSSVQQVTNCYQHNAVTAISNARSSVNALAANMRHYPKVS